MCKKLKCKYLINTIAFCIVVSIFMLGSFNDSFGIKDTVQDSNEGTKNQDIISNENIVDSNVEKNTTAPKAKVTDVEENKKEGNVIIKEVNSKIEISYNGDNAPIILEKTKSGKVKGKQIVNKEFKNISYYVKYKHDDKTYDYFVDYLTKNKYKVFQKKKGWFGIEKNNENKTFLFALVTITNEKKNKKNNDIRYLIYCDNANKKLCLFMEWKYGVFQYSEAIEIEILSCGSGITNMTSMFENCNNLKTLSLKRLITTNVKEMKWMFYNCKNLEKLILWETEINCPSMFSCFKNCFINKNAYIICTGSMMKKIQGEYHIPKILKLIKYYIIISCITGLEFGNKDFLEIDYNNDKKYKCTMDDGYLIKEIEEVK